MTFSLIFNPRHLTDIHAGLLPRPFDYVIHTDFLVCYFSYPVKEGFDFPDIVAVLIMEYQCHRRVAGRKIERLIPAIAITLFSLDGEVPLCNSCLPHPLHSRSVPPCDARCCLLLIREGGVNAGYVQAALDKLSMIFAALRGAW